MEPLFQTWPSFPVERGAVRLQPGDLVLFRFSYGFRAQIVRPLGKSGVLKDVMEALLADSGIRRGFSQAVIAEAAKAAPLHDVIQDPDRVDLRSLYTFTVDPVMAQDFDDALSFARPSEGVTTAYVHIADVSYFVAEGPPWIGKRSAGATRSTWQPGWSPCCPRFSPLASARCGRPRSPSRKRSGRNRSAPG